MGVAASWVCVVVDRSHGYYVCSLFFFQAEDGIRDLVRSRGLGDVYKRQVRSLLEDPVPDSSEHRDDRRPEHDQQRDIHQGRHCLLYTSDAADERSSVDLGGRRIIKKKKDNTTRGDRRAITQYNTLWTDIIRRINMNADVREEK